MSNNEPKIVYIAGPMSGYPAFNYPAFDAAEVQLAKTKFDFDPADVCTECFTVRAANGKCACPS